jgi:hypothetical protein
VYNVGGADLGIDFAYRQVQLFDNNVVVALKIGF